MSLMSCVLKNENGRTLLTAQKEFAVLVTQTMMEPNKVGFNFKSNKDEDQFVSCYVELLKAVRSTWPEYYTKLERYFSQAYQEDDMFNLNHICQGIINGEPNMHAVNAYCQLTKHKLLVSPVPGVQLLDALFSHLSTLTLNKISPNILKNLEVFVSIIFMEESESISERLMQIISSDLEINVWFLRTFSMLCRKPILTNMKILVSKGVQSGNILQAVQLLVNILVDRKPPGQGAELLDLVMEYWSGVKGSIDSRTDILKTVFLLRSLSKVAEFRDSNLEKAVSWFCNVLKNPALDLKVKYKGFTVLGLLLSSSDGKEIKDALLAFSSLISKHASVILKKHSLGKAKGDGKELTTYLMEYLG